MKTLLKLLPFFVILFFKTSCSNTDKPADSVEGTYHGKGTAGDNLVVKNIDMDIKTGIGAISGTYTFDKEEGEISGTAVGLIYTLKLTPKSTSGVVYNANITWDGKNTITGTMKGVEAGKTVTYNLVLNR